MSASLVLSGVDEMRQLLQALPESMAGEAQSLSENIATLAAADIRSAYPRRTGELAESVHLESPSVGEAQAATAVVNDSPLAAWFENGTQARHNALGANRGAMAPGHVFIPRIIRWRSQFLAGLRALVERAGIVVRGGG